MVSTIPSNNTCSANDYAIQVRGVSYCYGALAAIDGVDLAIRRGEIFGLIGHNGAGKSTLFKMMLGLLEPSAGEILVNGIAVTSRNFRQTRRCLGYLPENVVLYDNLTGMETLVFFAKLKGAPLEQCAPLLEKVGLANASKRPVHSYSKGMRQRLGFAQALLGNPQVLFLDEPSNGLDPRAIRDFYQILRELSERGVTIIITSHILAELQERVHKLAIISAGKIQAKGSVPHLREQMQMPLTIDVALLPIDAQSLQRALMKLPGVHSTLTAQGMRVHCPQIAKMAVLSLVMRLPIQIHDVRVQEASLEDVFFGFSD